MREITQVSPDPTGLRALAHPVRLRMLGLLRLEGPATATSLAARLGLNSGATSYHLRQLERHGFIEDDADRGNARERWWRARHESTRFDTGGDDAALDAGVAFAQVALRHQVEAMQAALDRHVELPADWRAASTASDFNIPMTATAARALVEKIEAILVDAQRAAPPIAAPREPDEKTVTFIFHAFPHPEGRR